MNIFDIYMVRYNATKKCTVVYDIHQQVQEVHMTPLEFFQRICLHYGSSMQVRMEQFRFLLDVQKKIPILVCHFRECIFFPTTSYVHEDCVWIQAKMVKKVSNKDNGCQLHLVSGQCVDLDVGCRVIYKQLRRCRSFLNQLARNVEVENL